MLICESDQHDGSLSQNLYAKVQRNVRVYFREINACLYTTVNRYILKRKEKRMNIIKIGLQVIRQDD